MIRPGFSPNLQVHGALALAAFAAFIVIGIRAEHRLNSSQNGQGEFTADIAVEHDGPLTLRLDLSLLNGQALLDIQHSDSATVKMSLPSAWKRSEVRNAPLADITAEVPLLGYTKWSIPAGAGVTYKIFQAPSTLLLHNPSQDPLQVQLTVVHLAEETVERNIILVHNQAVSLSLYEG